MGQQTNKYHISDDGKVYRINEDGSFTECEIIPKSEINNISTADSNKRNSKVKKAIVAFLSISVLIGIITAIYFYFSSNHSNASEDVITDIAESQIEDYNLDTIACSWDGDINNHYETYGIVESDETYTELSAYLNYNYSTNSDIAFTGDKFTMSFDIYITDTGSPHNLFEIVDGSGGAIPLFTVYYDANALYVRTFIRYDGQETVDIAENNNDNGSFDSVKVLSNLRKDEWMRVTLLYDNGDLFVNNHEFNISKFPKIFDKDENKFRYFISCELPYQTRSIRIKDFIMTV